MAFVRRRRVAKKRSAARKNPKRLAKRTTTVARRRRNPISASQKRGIKLHSQLRAQAAALGLSTKGTSAQLAQRIAAAGAPVKKKKAAKKTAKKSGAKKTAKKSGVKKAAARKTARKTAAKKSGVKKGGRKMTAVARRTRKPTKKQLAALRKARAARRVTGQHARRARAIIRSTRGKRSTKKAIARTYLHSRSIAQRAAKGRMSKENRELAQAMGLTRINPSMQAVAKDAGVMLTRFAAAGAGAVGGLVIGIKAGGWIQSKIADKNIPVPAVVKNNVVPLTTLGVAAAAWTGLKLGKKTQTWALPVGLGLGTAAAVLFMTHSLTGQKLLAKAGISVKIATAETEAVSGLGAYVVAPHGLGEYVNERGQLAAYVSNPDDEGVHALAGHTGIFAGLDDQPDFVIADGDMDNFEMGGAGIFGGSSI